MENELFTMSVIIVVIGSEIVSEVILRMLSGSFAQLVSFTVRTMHRISSWFISRKKYERQNRKMGN